MANKINYQINFDVNKATLSQLKSSLQELRKVNVNDLVKINDSSVADANKKLLDIEREAQNVEEAIQKAFNAKLNTVNIEEFNQSLKGMGSSIQDVYRAFSAAGPAGENAFRNLSAHVLSTNIQLKQSHTLLDKMATTLANSAKWSIASGIVNNFSRSIEQAWGYTKALDSSLNNIRIVTGKSADEMGKFAIQANNAAKELGKTTTDYTNAALIYAQQGLSDEQIAARTAITLKTANVTGQSADDVSEELTAVWNGYKVSADEAEIYVDRLAAVAATTASDLEELSTGMSKVASAAAAMGVGEDQLAAQLSTIISVTRQAPESVGTALRTVYARISDIKAGIDEDGVTLGRYSGQMADLGFNVLDATGNLRDMGEVMEQIGGRWQDLTRQQQISLAQTMAGQRQYSNLIALFDNFEEYNRALNTAQNAAGTLQKQQDTYMESTAAHLQQLKASVENIYDSLINTDVTNELIDGLSEAATVTASFIDSIGGGTSALRALGAIGVTVFSEQIAKGINTTITNLEIGRENARQFGQALQETKKWEGIPNLEETSKKLLENRESLLKLSKLMTPEQFSGMQKTLNDIISIGNEVAALENKIKPLQNVINLVSDKKVNDIIGNGNLEDQVVKDVQSYMELAQAVEETQNQFNKLDFSKKSEEISNDVKEMQSSVEEYMSKIDLLNQQGFLDKHQAELQQVTEVYNQLPKSIKTEEAKQIWADFFAKLKELALNATTELSEPFEQLSAEINDPKLVKQLEEKITQLKKADASFMSGQERMQKVASVENWAKMAGGLSQVSSAIMQIQNLGSIWKNSDLDAGEKLLQFVTNLSFSLPMLATGFTKATTALGLMEVMTAEEAIQAGIATAAETQHAFGLKMVGGGAEEAAIKVQLLNTTLKVNPFVAVAAGVIALVTVLSSLVKAADQANEELIKMQQTEIEQENKKQQAIEKNKQLYDSVEDLNNQYKNGEITRLELKSSIQDLINKYEIEDSSIKTLISDYGDLGNAIDEARGKVAKQGLSSATREKENAEQQVIATAKGKTFDNGRISGENYLLNISAGFSENSKIISAMQNAGAEMADGSMLFKTGSSAQDIISLYDNIASAVENIQKNVDSADRANSKYFKGMQDWLTKMQESVGHYREAIENINLYGTELEGFSGENDFNNISNISDYLDKRQAFIESVQKTLTEKGGSAESATETVDTYLSRYFKDAYEKYDEAANFVDRMRKQFGEANSDVEELLSELDSDHLDVLMSLDPYTIRSWDSLKEIIQRISKVDLSNINSITENPQEMMSAAAEQYSLYQSLEDQVRSGKSISKTEYQSLDPELQSYFSIMANGTFKMTEDAQEFYQTVNNFKLDGFKDTLAAAEQRLDQIHALQEKNFNYNNIDKQAFTGGSFFGLGKEIDYNVANEQLDYLNVAVENSNIELRQQIKEWQDLAEEKKLNADMVKDIANAIEEVGDKTKNLTQDQENLKEITKEAAWQLHDAMFPTDEDVDQSALTSLKSTLQSIADQSDELADRLSDGTEETRRDVEDVAESILRFDDAITDVVDNYEDWMDALNSGSIQEQAQVTEALRDAYADLLDLDGTSLSNDFLTNADNLNLMKAAIDGNTDAYDQLMQLAQQDIATQIGLDTTQFDAGFDHLMDLYYQGQDLDDMQIGASLDNQNFLAGLTEMVNAAGMTAQQATDYLASMGVDAEVVETKSQGTETKQQTGWTSTLVPNEQTGEVPIISGVGSETSISSMPITFRTYSSEYTPTTETVTDTKENSAFSLKVTSAHKSSGGGFKFSQAANGGGSKGAARRAGSGKKGGGGGRKGGGGSKKAAQPDTSKKDLKKEKEDQRDIYHDINIELDQINRELERVQQQQDRLYGKDLLDNLNKQTAILEQHKQVLEEKHELQKQDLESQKETLKNLGVTFDEYGNISNYLGILGQKQAEINAKTKEYNSLIEAYNESTNKDMKKNIADQAEAINKQIKTAEDEYKQLEKKIKNYDGLREDMEDLVDQIEKETQKQIELNIKKFRTQIELRLEMGEAERDWNQFRRDVLEHTDILKDTDFQKTFKDALQGARDITSYFDVNGSMGSLQMLTNQLMDTRAQIEAINETGKSAIYGDNKAQAMKDLQEDLDELMGQMEDVQKLLDDIDKAYLDTIDDISEQFDKQIEDYEYVGDLIEHDIDLLTLLYGEKNYDTMDRYFSTLERNNLKQLDSLKQQRDFWRQQWDAAVARGDTQAAKQFEQNYKDTINNLNKVIQDAAKNLQDKYLNAIDKIFDELDKKISNGYGTDYLSTEWQLMNKNADEYLDAINSAFAIQETERQYQDALNDTKSIKNQQALKNLMNEQLDILKNKEKITQYDIDRAQKLLQVQQARIALEDAQSAKTSLRLKRDSQGNYSYEYAADSGAVDEARAGLASAQNDLYNFDKERYQSNLDDILSAWRDFQSEYKDIITDSALTEQERLEKLTLLRQEYGQYINDKTAENLVIRNNLMESAFADLAALYDTDVDNYNQMAAEQQNILMSNLIPAWEGGIQQMTDKVAGEGGFIPTCEEAFESIEDQTKSYQESLQELADAAGLNLEDIQNGVDDLAYEFENLVEKNDDLIMRMNEEMFAIESLRNMAQALVNDYNNVYQAAADAVTQLHQFVQAEQAAAAAYQETARAYESMINRIQRANAAYAANPYGSYSFSGSGSNGAGNGSGSSGGTGGSGSGSGSGRGTGNNSNGYSKKVLTSIYDGSGRVKEWNHLITYDTGGYTGNWNSSEGRPAILHQKELVLNQDDTKNFLNSVKILRQINSNLNGTLINRANNIGVNFRNNDGKDEINQNVHIEATFPNVDSKREIEEAFNDLVNIAAQRALKI